MSAVNLSRRCVIEDHAFEINIEKTGEKWSIKVAASETAMAILGYVVHTALIYGPEKFLRSVAECYGQSFEGAVGYEYSQEEPDEITEGCVGLSYLDENLEVSQTLFRSLAVVSASILRDAIEAQGEPEPKWSELLDSIE